MEIDITGDSTQAVAFRLMDYPHRAELTVIERAEHVFGVDEASGCSISPYWAD
jgi:hypothetical protein